MTESLRGADESRVGIVETALELVFGTGHTSMLDRARGAKSCRRAPDAGVAICWGTSAFAARELQQRGYQTARRFVVLPSRANPKWLLPYDDRHAATSALRAYTSYSRRLPRAIAIVGATLKWPYMRRSMVTVATQQMPYFEAIAQEVAGQKNLGVAISIGAPGTFRKVSARWMRGDGDPVCHMKLPMSPNASARILHEARVLDALGRHGELRPHIPRLIQSGAVDTMQFLVQSSLGREAGPVQFGPRHSDFLRILHRHRPIRRSAGDVVEGVAERLRRNACRMGRRWELLGGEVLRVASQDLRNSSVDCGLSHGDFTPWNTRMQDRQLCVFDWEAAELNAPFLWDKFHFLTQTGSLLHQGNGERIPTKMTPESHASYLLYLLDSAARLAAEGTESNGVEYREAELLKRLRMGSQLTSTPRVVPIANGASLDFAATYDLKTTMGAVGE